MHSNTLAKHHLHMLSIKQYQQQTHEFQQAKQRERKKVEMHNFKQVMLVLATLPTILTFLIDENFAALLIDVHMYNVHRS